MEKDVKNEQKETFTSLVKDFLKYQDVERIKKKVEAIYDKKKEKDIIEVNGKSNR